MCFLKISHVAGVRASTVLSSENSQIEIWKSVQSQHVVGRQRGGSSARQTLVFCLCFVRFSHILPSHLNNRTVVLKSTGWYFNLVGCLCFLLCVAHLLLLRSSDPPLQARPGLHKSPPLPACHLMSSVSLDSIYKHNGLSLGYFCSGISSSRRCTIPILCWAVCSVYFIHETIRDTCTSPWLHPHSRNSSLPPFWHLPPFPTPSPLLSLPPTATQHLSSALAPPWLPTIRDAACLRRSQASKIQLCLLLPLSVARSALFFVSYFPSSANRPAKFLNRGVDLVLLTERLIDLCSSRRRRPQSLKILKCQKNREKCGDCFDLLSLQKSFYNQTLKIIKRYYIFLSCRTQKIFDFSQIWKVSTMKYFTFLHKTMIQSSNTYILNDFLLND